MIYPFALHQDLALFLWLHVLFKLIALFGRNPCQLNLQSIDASPIIQLFFESFFRQNTFLSRLSIEWRSYLPNLWNETRSEEVRSPLLLLPCLNFAQSLFFYYLVCRYPNFLHQSHLHWLLHQLLRLEHFLIHRSLQPVQYLNLAVRGYLSKLCAKKSWLELAIQYNRNATAITRPEAFQV